MRLIPLFLGYNRTFWLLEGSFPFLVILVYLPLFTLISNADLLFFNSSTIAAEKGRNLILTVIFFSNRIWVFLIEFSLKFWV